MTITLNDITELVNQEHTLPNSTARELFKDKELILYGAGESSHWFFEIIAKRQQYWPDLILDKNFSLPSKVEGVKALHPDQFFPTEHQLNHSLVIVCSGNDDVLSEIIIYLRERGFQQIISLHDIYDIHIPVPLPQEIEQQGANFFRSHLLDIQHAFNLLEDEKSKQIFHDYLKLHIQKRPVKLQREPRNEQYFPTDIKLSKGYQRFVSCGAYDGDTLKLLHSNFGKVESIVCFEADRDLYRRLVSYLEQEQQNLADNVLALPCAIYDREDIVKFTASTGLGSRIAPEGKLDVQSVSLDHLLPGFVPTYITMDIEGAELNALYGAEQTIKRAEPDLAISIYHSPDQLWNVLLYLNTLNEKYRFFIRNYTSFSTETILYATT